MTEVVSNTATANILLPILKEMSLTLCYNPVYMGENETVGTFELDNTETVTLLNLLNKVRKISLLLMFQQCVMA